MPELPDVEVLRRRFAKRALRRRIDAVNVPAPRILAGVSTREFRARLHPLTPPDAIDARGLARLNRAMRDVLKRAIACGADPERLPKNFLTPHRRAGKMCPRCGGTVQRLTIDGRSSYFCPRCQPKPEFRRGTEVASARSVLTSQA